MSLIKVRCPKCGGAIGVAAPQMDFETSCPHCEAEFVPRFAQTWQPNVEQSRLSVAIDTPQTSSNSSQQLTSTAYCPKCGSSHVGLRTDKKEAPLYDVLLGMAFFGDAGGVMAALSGENVSLNVCLLCGTSWDAATMFRLLRGLEERTGVTINLSREDDRTLLSDFIGAQASLKKIDRELERVDAAHQRDAAQPRIASHRPKQPPKPPTKCLQGLCFGLVGLLVLAVIAMGLRESNPELGPLARLIAMVALTLPLVGFFIGNSIRDWDRWDAQKHRSEAQKQKRKKAETDNLQRQRELMRVRKEIELQLQEALDSFSRG